MPSIISGVARFILLQNTRPLFTFPLLIWHTGTNCSLPYQLNPDQFYSTCDRSCTASDVVRLALGMTLKMCAEASFSSSK